MEPIRAGEGEGGLGTAGLRIKSSASESNKGSLIVSRVAGFYDIVRK